MSSETFFGRLALHHGVILLEAVAADAKVGNLEVFWRFWEREGEISVAVRYFTL